MTTTNHHIVPSYLINPQHPVTVNLIGCGGTGSLMLTHLARIDYALRAGGLGLGAHPGLHVRAFDGDTVSEANIGRQNYAPADIGTNKAVTLITRINRFYGRNWEAYPIMYDEAVVKQGLHLANIIISCVDTAKARILINELNHKGTPPVTKGNERLNVNHAYNKRYYWLDLGNSRDSGQVILGTINPIEQPKGKDLVGKLPDILTLFPNLEKHDTEEEQGASCSVAEALASQDLCTNSQMAEWGKKLVWNIFKKMKLEFHGVFINLNTLTVNPLPIKNELDKRLHRSRKAIRRKVRVDNTGRRNLRKKRTARRRR